MDKEEVKDKLKDLYKTLAILLGVVGFFGALFLPYLWGAIVFFLIVAGMHLWVISKIIARYKTMTQAQRKYVVYYFIALGISIIFILLDCSGIINNESNVVSSLWWCLLGSSWGIGRNALEMDEEE